MTSLKGQFLIATASLSDPNFSRAVVLILQHDDEGALGLVVNRPLDVTVRHACEQVLGVECEVDGQLHHGGPCEAVMMVLYADADADADSPGAVVAGLRVSSDKDRIERLLGGDGEAGGPPLKVVVGYSGWSAGQLEAELESGSWVTVPATAERALGPAAPLWTRLVTEANLTRFIDPKFIPDDPSVN